LIAKKQASSSRRAPEEEVSLVVGSIGDDSQWMDANLDLQHRQSRAHHMFWACMFVPRVQPTALIYVAAKEYENRW